MIHIWCLCLTSVFLPTTHGKMPTQLLLIFSWFLIIYSSYYAKDTARDHHWYGGTDFTQKKKKRKEWQIQHDPGMGIEVSRCHGNWVKYCFVSTFTHLHFQPLQEPWEHVVMKKEGRVIKWTEDGKCYDAWIWLQIWTQTQARGLETWLLHLFWKSRTWMRIRLF